VNKIAGIILLVVGININKAYSWGRQGHRIVALIAKSQVNKEVVSQVNQFLGGMSWEDAACWMDDVKGIAGSEYMKEWHYVNVLKDKTYVKRKTLNIHNQLEYYLKLLRNHEMYSKGVVFEALKIVFHLVGDISQPLHCGNAEDRGGTHLNVKYKSKNTNLHKVWDSEIIEDKNIDIWTCSKILLAFSEEEKKNCQNTNISNWINESRCLLKSAYDITAGTIDRAYIDKNAELIQKQLVKSGLRLAAILNANFKERI
jgi:hypothetical protein